MVVDETSTCCFAGGHGHFWQFNGSADYVSFGKRTQVSGFFHHGEGSTLAGSEHDVNVFQVIMDGVKEDKLAQRSKEASDKLNSLIGSLAQTKGIVSARHSGTNLWLDLDSPQTVQRLIAHLRSNGVVVSQHGQKGIVTKPSLVLRDNQVEDFAREMKKFN